MAAAARGRWTELLGEQVVKISRDSGPRTGRLTGHIVAGIGLVAASALFSSWVHVQCITLRYEVSKMYDAQQTLIQTRDALEIERQMLRSPQRIVRIAEQELGMRLPEAGELGVLQGKPMTPG